MVKWIAAIEFVHDFADLGAGQGGYNEDHEFYGYRMPIERIAEARTFVRIPSFRNNHDQDIQGW